MGMFLGGGQTNQHREIQLTCVQRGENSRDTVRTRCLIIHMLHGSSDLGIGYLATLIPVGLMHRRYC